jgi:hypothetical protein
MSPCVETALKPSVLIVDDDRYQLDIWLLWEIATLISVLNGILL